MLPGLKRVRVQVVTSEQLVKIRSIALREACRLAHIAHCYLQDLRQVVSSKFITRIRERRELAGVLAQ